MTKSAVTQSEILWEDLVVAVLSVNQYSLESTYRALEGIRAQRLADIQRLAKWTVQEIETRLIAASCDRGSFMTGLFAKRLHALGEHVERQGMVACEQILLSGDTRAIGNLLLPVNGVGPVVLKNFYLLRGFTGPPP